MDDTEIKVPMLKAISAWCAALITSAWQTWNVIPWDRLAQFAAFLYSLALLWEYVRMRWMNPKRQPQQQEVKDVSE